MSRASRKTPKVEVPNAPLVLEPEQVHALLDHPKVRLIDLCGLDRYARRHLPGALPLDYNAIVEHVPPVFGLLPNELVLGRALSNLGISKPSHVIAYDNEGGGKAGRLLWTLAVCGHHNLSLLNGGIDAWEEAGLPVSDQTPVIEPTEYPAQYSIMRLTADRNYIQNHLGEICLVDTRSRGEYEGSDLRAARGGHIPGAVHFEWTQAMDRSRDLRILPEAVLRPMLEQKGITPDKEIVVYCHSHHRSAFLYWVLKSLGYERVRGYPGSWSDWGNQPDTAVEK